MKIPRSPRLLAQDVTAEKVKSLLYEHGGRLAIMSAEGEIFDLMAGRYGHRGSANFGAYLDGHSGDDIRVDRVGRPTEYVRKPAITIGLSPQPDVIHNLSEQQGFRGRGLLARFLYVMAVSLVGHRKPNPPPVPANVREEYVQKMRLLLDLCPGQASGSEYNPHELKLSPQAENLRVDFVTWLEPQLAPTGELGHIADWAGKLAGHVLRIAGLLHMAEHADKTAPWDLPIEEETLKRAIAIGHYLIPHARAAFGLMGADPVIADARHILSWIFRTGMTSFTRRDLFEATKGRFKEVRALELPLDCLIRHGYLRERPGDSRSGPGRKPSTIYDVNPLARSQDSQKSQNLMSSPHSGLPDQDSANTANCAMGSACDEMPTPSSPSTVHDDFEEGVL
jgi:hypothetical protein